MSLTREEIAGAVARGYCTTANMHKELDADLVTGITNEVMALLQSLSQEAVRDEALSDAIKMCETIAATGGSATHCIEYLKTLKREPNAAGPAVGQFAPYDAPDPNRPAPAAPDVAEMVKRLRDSIAAIKRATLTNIDNHIPIAEEAAALLSKLGQGWIPHSVQEAQDMIARCNSYLHREVLGDQRKTVSFPPVPGASDD